MTYAMYEPARHESRLMLGLLVGAAVGGGVALLFAPRQGADTRRELAATAQRTGRRLNETYDQVSSTVRTGARRIADEAQHLRARAGDAANSMRDAVEDTAARMDAAAAAPFGPVRTGTAPMRATID